MEYTVETSYRASIHPKRQCLIVYDEKPPTNDSHGFRVLPTPERKNGRWKVKVGERRHFHSSHIATISLHDIMSSIPQCLNAASAHRLCDNDEAPSSWSFHAEIKDKIKVPAELAHALHRGQLFTCPTAGMRALWGRFPFVALRLGLSVLKMAMSCAAHVI